MRRAKTWLFGPDSARLQNLLVAFLNVRLRPGLLPRNVEEAGGTSDADCAELSVPVVSEPIELDNSVGSMADKRGSLRSSAIAGGPTEGSPKTQSIGDRPWPTHLTATHNSEDWIPPQDQEERTLARYFDEVERSRFRLQTDFCPVGPEDVLRRQQLLLDLVDYYASRLDPMAPKETPRGSLIKVLRPTASGLGGSRWRVDFAENLLAEALQEIGVAFDFGERPRRPGRPSKRQKPVMALTIRLADTTLATPFLALATLLSDPHGPYLRRCQLEPLADVIPTRRRRRRAVEFAAGCGRWFLATRRSEVFCCKEHQAEARRRAQHAGPDGPNAARVRRYREKRKNTQSPDGSNDGNDTGR